MKTAVDYLRTALKEMRASRAELDRQIEILENTLGELDAGSGAVDKLSELGPSAPTVREIVMNLVATQGTVTPNEVVNAAHQLGNSAKYESVSSILSRLHKEGVLQKGERRGTYRLPDAAGDSNDDDGDRSTVVDETESPNGHVLPGTIVR